MSTHKAEVSNCLLDGFHILFEECLASKSSHWLAMMTFHMAGSFSGTPQFGLLQVSFYHHCVGEHAMAVYVPPFL